MKKIFLLITFAAALAADAAPKKELTIEQIEARKAQIQKRIYSRTGGILNRKITKGRRIAYLNMQNRVADKAVANVLETQNRIVRRVITFERFDGKFDITIVPEMIKKANAAEVIFIIDDPVLPSILVAHESNWALINVSALASDKPDQLVLEERVRLEMWRTFALLNGAANSVMGKCVLKSVFKNSDLDALGAKAFSPEPLNKIFQHLDLTDVAKRETCTYRKACEEGWAPAPKDDVQRKIWNEVRAVPKNPMKIEFDPKKGR